MSYTPSYIMYIVYIMYIMYIVCLITNSMHFFSSTTECDFMCPLEEAAIHKLCLSDNWGTERGSGGIEFKANGATYLMTYVPPKPQCSGEFAYHSHRYGYRMVYEQSIKSEVQKQFDFFSCFITVTIRNVNLYNF